MVSIDELGNLLRRPKYPVIVDIDGSLIAAKSAKALCIKLSRFDLEEKKSYNVIEASTNRPWTLIVIKRQAILSPLNFEKPKTKLGIIRWFNGRKNRPAGEVAYSEKSLSSKRLDFIISDIADRLLEAEKRPASH